MKKKKVSKESCRAANFERFFYFFLLYCILEYPVAGCRGRGIDSSRKRNICHAPGTGLVAGLSSPSYRDLDRTTATHPQQTQVYITTASRAFQPLSLNHTQFQVPRGSPPSEHCSRRAAIQRSRASKPPPRIHLHPTG